MKKTKAKKILIEENKSEIFTNIRKSASGITLLALVVTIIVLLILASISIATLSGDNGVIENAIWGSFGTEMKDLSEQIEIEELRDSAKTLNGEGTRKNIYNPCESRKVAQKLKNGDIICQRLYAK